MNTRPYLGPYIASRRLLIPGGPGKLTVTVRAGDVFSFDGDEPIDVDALLRSGAIRPYNRLPSAMTEVYH